VQNHELIEQKQWKAAQAEAASKVTALICRRARKFPNVASKWPIFNTVP